MERKPRRRPTASTITPCSTNTMHMRAIGLRCKFFFFFLQYYQFLSFLGCTPPRRSQPPLPPPTTITTVAPSDDGWVQDASRAKVRFISSFCIFFYIYLMIFTFFILFRLYLQSYGHHSNVCRTRSCPFQHQHQHNRVEWDKAGEGNDRCQCNRERTETQVSHCLIISWLFYYCISVFFACVPTVVTITRP